MGLGEGVRAFTLYYLPAYLTSPIQHPPSTKAMATERWLWHTHGRREDLPFLPTAFRLQLGEAGQAVAEDAG